MNDFTRIAFLAQRAENLKDPKAQLKAAHQIDQLIRSLTTELKIKIKREET